MKKLYFSVLLLTVIFCAKDLCARQLKGLYKYYEVVSLPYSVPDNSQWNFADLTFKLGWNKKTPCAIGIQFVNHGYVIHKIKFAIEDVTTKKMLILDTVHHSRFGLETIKDSAEGIIWSGLVDNIKDSFSLHVWDENGDEFDKEPVSINNQP
jgi:hypothetical protein